MASDSQTDWAEINRILLLARVRLIAANLRALERLDGIPFLQEDRDDLMRMEAALMRKPENQQVPLPVPQGS